MILTLNNPQNNLQLIKLENGFIVIDLVAEIRNDNCKFYYYKHFGEDIISNLKESLSSKVNTLENLNTKDRYYKNIIFASQSILDSLK